MAGGGNALPPAQQNKHMMNRKSLLAAALVAVCLTLTLALPFTAPAQQSMGDSPAVYSLMASTSFAASQISTTWTNTGLNQGNAYLLLSVTNTAGTTPSLTCTVWTSPDNSTWTALPTSVSVTTNTPALGGGCIAIAQIGAIQNYAFLRTTNVLGGSASPAYGGSLSLIMPPKYL